MNYRRSGLPVGLVCALLGASASAAGWEEGVAAFTAGNYARAIAEFQQFVDERTDEEALVVGYQMLAQSLLRGGRAKESVAAFQRHLELKPGDAGSQLGLGQAYYTSGEPAQCLATLNNLSIGSLPEPHRNHGYRLLASALLVVGPGTEGTWARTQVYLRAEEVAERLVESVRNYDNLVLLGQARLGAGRYQAAISTLRRAIKLERNEWLPHYYIGQALTSRGRFKKAESPLGTALELASGSDADLVWKQLGYVFWSQGKYAEAANAYGNAGDFESVRRVREGRRIAVEEQQIAEEDLRSRLKEWRGSPWHPSG